MPRFFRKIKEFFFPDMYSEGFKYIMLNWSNLHLEKFLYDLRVVEKTAGGGDYEDGMHDAIKYLQDKPKEYRRSDAVKRQERDTH